MYESNLVGITISYVYYYFGFLFIGLWEMLREIISPGINKDKKELSLWLALGYLTFLIPTGVIYIITELGLQIIPSVMCGFAVFMALILAFKIVPIINKLNI